MHKLVSKFNNYNLSNINFFKSIYSPTLSIEYNLDNYSILKILESEGIIKDLTIKKIYTEGSGTFKRNIDFTFTDVINIKKYKLKQISKAGRKVYFSSNSEAVLSPVKNNKLSQSKISIKEIFSNKGHIYFIRTSKGIMTDKDAIKLNLGGELLLKLV